MASLMKPESVMSILPIFCNSSHIVDVSLGVSMFPSVLLFLYVLFWSLVIFVLGIRWLCLLVKGVWDYYWNVCSLIVLQCHVCHSPVWGILLSGWVSGGCRCCYCLYFLRFDLFLGFLVENMQLLLCGALNVIGEWLLS